MMRILMALVGLAFLADSGIPNRADDDADRSCVILHVGNLNPANEKWTFGTGSNGVQDAKPVVPAAPPFAGKGDDGVPSWYVAQAANPAANGGKKFGLGYYRELGKEQFDQVTKRGWVLDVIVRSSGVNGMQNTGTSIIYGVTKKAWPIHINTDNAGNAAIIWDGEGAGKVATGKNGFVHIRVVGEPNDESASIFIDGVAQKGIWKGEAFANGVPKPFEKRIVFGAAYKTIGVGKGEFALVLFAGR